MPEASVSPTLHRAVVHHQAGRLPEAEALYREVLAHDPDCIDALHLLGVVADQVGQHDVALELIGRAAVRAPNNPAIHSNLGEAYRHLNRLDEAVASLRRALSLQPNFPEAWSNLGNALATQCRSDEAIVCYRKALALKPDLIEAHNNLGGVLMERGEFDEAVACYRQALALKPDYADAHNNLGRVFQDLGQLTEALACYRKALALKPNLIEAHSNLGGVFSDQGQLDDAIACYRHALALKPDYAIAHSSLIFILHYCAGHDAGTINAELDRWNQQHARPLVPFIKSHPNDRSPGRRLRIGYVSPDFWSHPVGRFLLPLLASHDRQSFEIFCYSNASRADKVTAQLRDHADGWRELAGRTDQQVADLIREDRIDILVDLALHTAKNRLLVFAHKPAPVQVTYLAYPGNSGLDTIDYRITDVHLDPPGQEPQARGEKPVRLPETYWCYRPSIHPSPEVGPLPALTAGQITFGCLNAFSKVTPATLAVWCRLLSMLGNARLILHAQPGSHRARVRDLFATNGIDPLRLVFASQVPPAQYLQSYGAIDIGLDPFPFPGGTTTCDALWMGVPVVSLAGPTPVTRGGLSLLSNVGLPELVAHSVDDYIEKAVALAQDLPRLAALRASLRERMQRSPLMDAPRFARDLEAAYRAMWHRWCARPPAPSPSIKRQQSN